jgi:hypothetical protein
MNYKLYNVFDIRKEFDAKSNMIILSWLFISVIFIIASLVFIYSKKNWKLLSIKESVNYQVACVYMIIFPFLLSGLIYLRHYYLLKSYEVFNKGNIHTIIGEVSNYNNELIKPYRTENFVINGISFQIRNDKEDIKTQRFKQLLNEKVIAVVFYNSKMNETRILKIDTISIKK